ncbi:pentatricopeptide repeat-containing protein At5g66520-like [Aristolochia californica]|uniref:pentatricopeptide repeat-containing protein At5g66520-like n=1 Tax=Aristolochia californica TaxID=171875 RepID=UPI0035E3938A
MALLSQADAISKRILHLLSTPLTSFLLRQIESQIILQSLHSDTKIFFNYINACNSLNLLPSALDLFNQLDNPHVFICNNLIKSFSHSNSPENSISVYSKMRKSSIAANNYTFPFVLKALSDLRLLRRGQSVHTHVIKTGHSEDIYVQNSLMDLYSSCGLTLACVQVFDEMPLRDAVSWTTLICAHRIAGRLDAALFAFERMRLSGITPNHVTMVNVLAACAGAGALDMGVWVHDYMKRNGWELDVILGTSLIDMYGRCGRIEMGLRVFETLVHKNIFTWNSLIRGLALAKHGEDAVSCFFRMEAEGVKPDRVTLIGVLCACSHSGLVEAGRQIFYSMIDGRFGFSPEVKHYGCMVDLLARAGLIDEARGLIECLPFEPNKFIWGALLAGCRAHGNLELCEFAARRLLELEPHNGAYYVLLSNLYSEMGKWHQAEQLRRLMEGRGIKKDIGWSASELQACKENRDACLPCI